MSPRPPSRRSTRSSSSSVLAADPGRGPVRRCGGGRRRAGRRGRAAAADERAAAPPAPSPVLTTPLLSFRRAPGRAGPRRQPRGVPGRGRRRSAARWTRRRASSVAVDGVPVGVDASRPAADPGQQPEAARRRRRPRGARRRPHVHDRGPRRAAPVGRRRRRRPLPRRRRRPAADELDVSGRPTTPTRSPARRRSTRSPTPSWPPGCSAIDGAVIGDAIRYDDEFFAPELGQRRPRHRGRSVRRPAGQRRPRHRRPAAGVGPGRRARPRELTQLLAAKGVTVAGDAGGRRGAGRRAGAGVGARRRRCRRSSARCWRRATTTRPRCCVKELGVAAAAAAPATAGLAVMTGTLQRLGDPDGRASCSPTAPG